MAPIPDLDASHTTHIGFATWGSIGHNMGVLLHVCLIMSKQCWCRGRQLNMFLFCVMANNGPVYAMISGRNTDKYCMRPTNLWMSWYVWGVHHSIIHVSLSLSACSLSSSIMYPKQSMCSTYSSHFDYLRYSVCSCKHLNMMQRCDSCSSIKSKNMKRLLI